jgi:hypothetical protein
MIKHSPFCRIKYLVTGTGRCGTVYIARFLTYLKIYCGHEAIFDYGGIVKAKKRMLGQESIKTSSCSIFNKVKMEETNGWFEPKKIIAESSYMAAPFLNENTLKNVFVIHLVRNPLKVLSSWVLDLSFFSDNSSHHLLQYKNFILRYVPKINEEKTEIEKTCRYLLEWNRLIKNCPQKKILVKIENYPYKNLLANLNIDNSVRIFPNVPINSWKERDYDLRLEDIPDGPTKLEFLNMIKEYNY